MKAVLLCAGFGTRLYPLTRDKAKPLLPVAAKPIVEYLVDQIACHVDEIAVVSNARFFDEFVEWAPPNVTVLNDGATTNENRLGAARDLAFAISSKNIRGPAVVAAGDNLFEMSFEAFFGDYRSSPRNLVLRYRETDPAKRRRTGIAEIGEDGRLLRFWEKSPDPPTEWACPALYILEPEALDLLPTFLEEDPDTDALGSFIAWLAERSRVYTHEMQGRRLDVGDLEGYRRADSWLDEHG